MAESDWVDVPKTTQRAPAPAAASGDWVDVPKANPLDDPNFKQAAMPAIKGAVEPILNAFGQGFREGWGPDRLGIPDAEAKKLSKIGIFAPEGQTAYTNPFHAFNELLAETIYRTPEIMLRGTNALYRGIQAAGVEAGAPNDIMSLPEAFFGSPHPTGIPKTLPELAAALPEALPKSALPLQAAVRVNGEIFTGPIHALALEAAEKKLGRSAVQDATIAESQKLRERAEAGEDIRGGSDLNGFLTADGRFINRQEANELVNNKRGFARAEDLNLGEARDLSLPEAFFGSPHPTGIPKKLPAPVARGLDAIHEPGPARPKASDWVAYHGTAAEVDFGVNFDQMVGGNIGEHGVSFFSPDPRAANVYTETNTAANARGDAARDAYVAFTNSMKEKYGTTQWDRKATQEELKENVKLRDAYRDSREPPEGAAGPRIIPVRIEPGKTETFDVSKLFGENNKEFLDALRETYTNPELGHAPPAYREYSPEERGRIFDQRLASIRRDYESHESNRARILEETKNEPGGAVDIGPWKAPLDLIAPTVELAKKHGLDTARITGLAEHGEQIIALNSDNIKPYFSPIEQARDLGVIGEPKMAPPGAPPKEAAHNAVPDRTMAAEQQTKPEDVIRDEPNPARDKAGNIRLDQIGINGDAKDVIRQAAESNNDFMDARLGNVPLAQIESLSEASGIPSAELTANDGLGRLMHNDAVVRTWMEAFHQATNDIAEQMAKFRESGSEADAETLREMKLRFQHMQEQASGLTAEAGRTLRVFRDFYASKGQAEAVGKLLEDNPGNDTKSLKKLADAAEGLDKPQTAKLLDSARRPTFWDKAIYYWVNALISGPITHAKYVIANAAFGAYEAGVVTPLAAAIGTAKKLVGGESERVYHGETVARLWGLVAGAPDAFMAAWQAGKTGLQTPLPGEIAQNIVPKKNKNVFFQSKPIGGKLGLVIGAPSHGASAIHSFFNFLGYRASIEQQAYRMAAKEGLSVTHDSFWNRRQTLTQNPTKEMMDNAIEEGYRLTFINKLGPSGAAISNAVNKAPALKPIMPFTHIPFNILNRAMDNTVLSVFSKSAREDILGKNGGAKQDTQIARVVAGSALGAWMVNLALNDRITGGGPTDQKEREQWFATGHQPYSIRLGDQWYSFNRFGPIGTMMGLHANFAEVAPYFKWDGEEMTKAAAMLVRNFGRIFEDEVGMQGLANLIKTIDEPERAGVKAVSAFTASWLPYSSLLRQTAAFNDPELRETKSFLDGLRYAIPGSMVGRESLYPKRNALTGEPISNPSFHSIIRTAGGAADPLALEMKALDLPIAQPQDRIGGVKLTPAINDKYQALAGALVRQTTDMMRNSPGWDDLQPFVRQSALKGAIAQARKSAAAAIQVTHPELIQQGIQDKVDMISGQKPKKRLAEP